MYTCSGSYTILIIRAETFLVWPHCGCYPANSAPSMNCMHHGLVCRVYMNSLPHGSFLFNLMMSFLRLASCRKETNYCQSAKPGKKYFGILGSFMFGLTIPHLPTNRRSVRPLEVSPRISEPTCGPGTK